MQRAPGDFSARPDTKTAKSWKYIFNFFTGIGIATTVIATLCNTYYIVILAWDLSYLSNAFHAVLPWSHCNNTWNTPRSVKTLLLHSKHMVFTREVSSYHENFLD